MTKKLSSRKRLDRCFRHLEIDRPGLYLRGVTETSPPDPSYEPLRELVLAKGDLKANWDYGHLVPPLNITEATEPYSADFERCITTVHTPAGALQTSRLAGLRGQPGMVEKHLVTTVEDAEKYLSLPVPRIQGDASSFFTLDKEMGDRGIVDVCLGLNPGGAVAALVGSTEFALFSIEHRDMLHALMQHRLEHQLELAKFLLERGVGPYFSILGQEYITPPLHGPADFNDFNLRYDRPIADLVHEAGGYLHVHCHGPLADVLDVFIDLGADVLHPIEAPPLGDVTAKRAKQILRGKVCIEGNVQIGDMYTCTVQEVRTMAAELVEDAFDDRAGLIVCPTASPYVPEMSAQCYDNYAALVDVVTTWDVA